MLVQACYLDCTSLLRTSGRGRTILRPRWNHPSRDPDGLDSKMVWCALATPASASQGSKLSLLLQKKCRLWPGQRKNITLERVQELPFEVFSVSGFRWNSREKIASR